MSVFVGHHNKELTYLLTYLTQEIPKLRLFGSALPSDLAEVDLTHCVKSTVHNKRTYHFTSNRHLDWFSRFCRAHGRVQHTDRPRYVKTSASGARIYSLSACDADFKNMKRFTYEVDLTHCVKSTVAYITLSVARRLANKLSPD